MNKVIVSTVTAMIQGHPWDLWGLACLLDGSNTEGLAVFAVKPKGQPRIDHKSPEAVQRFRRSGYNLQGNLSSNTLDQAFARGAALDELASVAANLVTRINGTAKLLDPEYYLVRLLSVTTPSGMHILAQHTPNKDYTSLGRHVSQAPAALAFIELAGRDHAANFLLETFNLPISWASLYLAYDCIMASVGGVHRLRDMGWVSNEELSDFAYTANKTRDVRSGIRHGSHPDANLEKPFIPLHQGHSTVMRLAICWMGWRLTQAGTADR